MHDQRLRDFLPEPLPALPPPGVKSVDSALLVTEAAEPGQTLTSGTADADSSVQRPAEVSSGRLNILETPRNVFGLFRRYRAESLPCHDPESEVTLSMLSNIVNGGSSVESSNSLSDPVSSFKPYPNENSFLLGEWYWNSGTQKSQQDFKDLLRIVSCDSFIPAEVRAANWDKINQQLALNQWDNKEWVEDDADWRNSPITVQVPFHRLTDDPGIREYTILDFHHRSLVSIIRNKLGNECDSRHFHYEPYELLWQPTQDLPEVRVHGELFTSPAFIDAHNELQSLPGEPGCNLPRVVVALMFWSDSTHLTNFGDTKLWPLYMFFGNESKYRRCRPSTNLCEHVAYFEKVM
jgi:Plavaka transposase